MCSAGSEAAYPSRDKQPREPWFAAGGCLGRSEAENTTNSESGIQGIGKFPE